MEYVKVDPRFHFRLNCTSDSGHPAPDLAWFINGKMAEPRQLLHYPVLQHENGDQPVLLHIEKCHTVTFQVYKQLFWVYNSPCSDCTCWALCWR